MHTERYIFVIFTKREYGHRKLHIFARDRKEKRQMKEIPQVTMKTFEKMLIRRQFFSTHISS